MASEQRTEPGGQAIHMASGVRLRQVPPVIAGRVWRFGLIAGISRPGEAPFVRGE